MTDEAISRMRSNLKAMGDGSLELLTLGEKESYEEGFQDGYDYRQKRITELEAFIEQQSKRMVKLIKEGGGDEKRSKK